MRQEIISVNVRACVCVCVCVCVFILLFYVILTVILKLQTLNCFKIHTSQTVICNNTCVL